MARWVVHEIHETDMSWDVLGRNGPLEDLRTLIRCTRHGRPSTWIIQKAFFGWIIPTLIKSFSRREFHAHLEWALIDH